MKARHMLSSPYGGWRRLCASEPSTIKAWASLESALDSVLWNYSDRRA